MASQNPPPRHSHPGVQTKTQGLDFRVKERWASETHPRGENLGNGTGRGPGNSSPQLN